MRNVKCDICVWGKEKEEKFRDGREGDGTIIRLVGGARGGFWGGFGGGFLGGRDVILDFLLLLSPVVERTFGLVGGILKGFFKFFGHVNGFGVRFLLEGFLAVGN